MLSLDDARTSLDPALLDRPGGFAWWYAELSDPERDRALVCIWSFGLPFLPGYMGASRRGPGVSPRARPSLNLALYERGQLRHYLLHEFAPSDAEWSVEGATERWRFGNTRIVSEQHEGRRRVRFGFDVPVEAAGGRWTGSMELEGIVPRIASEVPAEWTRSPHRWTPLVASARGEAELSLAPAIAKTGGDAFSLNGNAYHDRNGAPATLEELGIREWIWTHGVFAGEERIAYVLTSQADPRPRAIGFRLEADGALHVDELTFAGPPSRRTLWGMPGRERLELGTRDQRQWMSVALRPPVDDGPFYLRYLGVAEHPNGVQGESSLEVIVPARIDLDRHRPLVQMRVASDQRRSSIWLPLFQGDLQLAPVQLARGWARRLRRGGARAEAAE